MDDNHFGSSLLVIVSHSSDFRGYCIFSRPSLKIIESTFNEVFLLGVMASVTLFGVQSKKYNPNLNRKTKY